MANERIIHLVFISEQLRALISFMSRPLGLGGNALNHQCIGGRIGSRMLVDAFSKERSYLG
jgi:hypothetical protein